MTKKNKQNNDKNLINKMIEKTLQSKNLNHLNFKDKNIDEIIEEINIYHQELEFQNIELSRIREELEKSKSHYIELFHNAPIGYVVFKEDSIIKEVNTTFAKLVNYDIKSIIGSKITKYIHPNDQDKFYIITKKLLKEKSTNSIELVFKGNTNCTTIAEFNLYPANPGSENKQNNLIRMAVTDISIRKKMELDILKAKEKAEESDKLKSAFLANMSHEIRTPMNGILGFTELLKNTNLNKNQKSHYLSIIEKSGKRMLSIINDLFDISRIEAGQIEVYNEKVSVNEVMKSLYDFFVEDANNKNLDLQCSHLKEEKPFTIYTDKEKLNATMSNLLKNAIKFTSAGNISFGYEIKNDKIVFFVRDTGTGIPKNKQSYIFDRFVQGNYSNSRDYEGAGLGLAISKAYVEIMNGEIWVESKENAGSTFYFSFPMLKENTNQHNLSNNNTKTDNDLNNH
ncbi:MAG: ATP-binding protein, partial [Bacteroidales bacterium]